jgi:hypothetical protein
MLLSDIGVGKEVHDLDFEWLKKTSEKLYEYQYEMTK